MVPQMDATNDEPLEHTMAREKADSNHSSAALPVDLRRTRTAMLGRGSEIAKACSAEDTL